MKSLKLVATSRLLGEAACAGIILALVSPSQAVAQSATDTQSAPPTDPQTVSQEAHPHRNS